MKEKMLLLYSALRDKRTPWYAKTLAGLLLAYIISPIDIIPDFIPIIGLLDEMILVPILLWIIFKMIPDSVKAESVSEINKQSEKKFYIYGIVLVFLIWVVCIYTVYQYFLTGE